MIAHTTNRLDRIDVSERFGIPYVDAPAIVPFPETIAAGREQCEIE